MKNWLKKEYGKLASKKYLHIDYYENNKKHIKRFKLTDLEIELCTSCFNIDIYSITFLKEKVGIPNIYGVKFSNNERESWRTIEKAYHEAYCTYTNLDNYDESAGSVSCEVIGNKTQFRFDVNCFYSHSGDIYNVKEWINNKEAHIYVKDKEIISKIKNYDKIIEEEDVEHIYLPRNITKLRHSLKGIQTKKRWFRHHK